MERETGFEPATPCLEGRHSTTELLPHSCEFHCISHQIPNLPPQTIRISRVESPELREVI